MEQVWDGTKERRQHPYCAAHAGMSESMALIKAELISIKESVKDIPDIRLKLYSVDTRINGSIDDIEKHIEHGNKWRMGIAGTAATLIFSIVTFAFFMGTIVKQMEINSNRVTLIVSELIHKGTLKDEIH